MRQRLSSALACRCRVLSLSSSALARRRAQLYEAVGIRAQGMAGAFVAVADDATGDLVEPGRPGRRRLLQRRPRSGRREPPSDRRRPATARRATRSFAVAFPALGLSYYRLRISEIQPPASTATAAGEPTR